MDEQGLINLLTRLVAIPSVTPGEAEDPAWSGERRMADFVAEVLARLGFRVSQTEKIAGRPNIVAEYGPDDARRTLLLESHLDTVGVSGMKRPPFDAMIEGGRLYGRGACDTKGPMAAALAALDSPLLERLASRGWRLVFAGAMGEETGNVGAAQLVEDGVRADQAIVLEPTELAIIHAHKGALWFEIEVGGVAVHGSNPERGVNAITAMADVIRFLREQIQNDQKQRHALLGVPSLNIGMIRGGDAVNIVPDRCVMQVDRRTLPEENAARIIEQIRERLALMQQEGRIAGNEIRMLKEGAPFETAADSVLVRTLTESCRRAGVESKLEGAAWYSDAGPLSHVCPEIVVFGPGSIRQAHTADEFIDLDSLRKGTMIIREFLDHVASETG
jgi:acetylornithine deacetylase/succinyl-diaminopimelate desuccinylase family protein